jgi:hypothetical protein
MPRRIGCAFAHAIPKRFQPVHLRVSPSARQHKKSGPGFPRPPSARLTRCV